MTLEDRYSYTLRDMIVNNAAWYSDSIAYAMDDVRVTNAEFLVRARKLADGLVKLGVKPQDRIGILGMNSLAFCDAYGACELYGFIASTVNFRFAPPEMEFVINDASQKVLILDEAYVEAIDQVRGSLKSVETFIVNGRAPDWAVSLDDVMTGGNADGPDLPPPRPTDIVYIIYTSGTTGRPKGVMLDQLNGLEKGKQISMALQNSDRDRTLLMMPFFHIGAKAVDLASHWRGGTVHIHETFDPVKIFKTIEREKITHTHLAPTMVQALLDHPDRDTYDLSSLRVVLYSAAPMSVPVLRRAIAAFGPVFLQLYGQTEGSGTVLPIGAHNPDGDEKAIRRLSSIGHTVVGCHLRIVDENDNDVGVDEPGEICLRGPATMRGYWNNTAATLEAMRGGWLHTGDIGKFDENGFVYLVDRKKDMIVSGGENIYSREVEAALQSHPDVEDAAIIGVPSKKWGEMVFAVVVPVKGKTLTEDVLTAHCRTQIAGYKRPKAYEFVSDLPKLASGKIDKKVLRAAYTTPRD